jgi:serine/threonine protein phosphatase PrpC
VSACPNCGAGVAAEDEFCEACGQALHEDSRAAAAPAPGSPVEPAARTESTEPPTAATIPPAPGCCACGGTFDADGWCDRCGQRAPSDRDHLVVEISPRLGAVCDKGRHHPRNEDAVALAEAHCRRVLVVCDGVSSTTDSDVAAVAAANAACDVLAAAPSPNVASPAARVEYYSDLMSNAATVANAEAIGAARRVGGENAPSCTFAAAVVDGELVVAGWVGDSRVYWLGDDGTALQLSIDDSWVTDQVDHGMSRAQAEADPMAHSITRWLGADATDPTARCGSLAATGAGWVLVCSDGLWNYCSGASDIAELIAKYEGRDPTEVAGHLVDWANEQGGHDNITVALARVERDDLPGSTRALPGSTTALPGSTTALPGSTPATQTHAAGPQTRSS